MENTNFDNNDKKIESVYSTRIRAGKRRTYFFDVRATRANDYFLTITESRKRFDNNGYDRHKVFIYKEDFNKFIKAVNEAIDFVKTELMPDFDFDAFNHEEAYNPEDANARDDRGIPSPSPLQTNSAQEQPLQASAPEVKPSSAIEEANDDKDPIEITEKKPLEARDTKASEGDNLSGEEVDKW